MRYGTEADWRELHRVIDAMVKGHISFSRFAELGRRWLRGADSEELAGMLPMSETERVLHYLKGLAGLRARSARDIDDALGLRPGRTAELCGPMRKRGLVKTTKHGRSSIVHLLDEKRSRGKSHRGPRRKGSR